MKTTICVLVAVLAAFTESAKWTSLKTTWNVNPFSSNAFSDMPRNLHVDAMGFTMMDDQCNGQQPKGPFAGKRYWKNNDPAIVLIFDVNGIIAGIQTVVPKSQWSGPASNELGHTITADGDNYVLTAYFVDTKIICNGGRSATDLELQGTGTGLYFQNGPDPINNLITVARDEITTQLHSKWTLGHCFFTMGVHYWWNVRLDMPCNEFMPIFLLYNKGDLNAFGWAMNTKLTSPRYEHPPFAVLGKFINPLPQCFQTEPSYQEQSTMHVYFTSEVADLC